MIDRMLRVGLVIAAAVTVVSIVGLVTGIFIDTEKTETITLAEYNHQGSFNLTNYTDPARSTSSSPVLYSRIIDRIDILFAYQGPHTGDTSIHLYIGERNGGWEKEVPITSSHIDDTTVSFPLDLEDLIETGNRISENLTGNVGAFNGSYNVRIEAIVPTSDESFVSSLTGELSSTILQWTSNFCHCQRGFPGDNELHQGSFGYRAVLKDNELYGATILEHPPDLEPPQVIPDDYPLNNVGMTDVGFTYQFSSNVPVQVSTEATVTMKLYTADQWERSFTLIPATQYGNNFTIAVPLDITTLAAMVDEINTDMGVRLVNDRKMDIIVGVRTLADTEAAPIEETNTYQLTGELGNPIEWTVNGGNGAGLVERAGSITSTITEPNTLYLTIRKYSIPGTIAGISLLALLSLLYWWQRPGLPEADNTRRKNFKKYKDIISEVDSLPQNSNQHVINVSSLDSLASIANNSLKPILFTSEPFRDIYFVYDGQLTYIYVFSVRPSEYTHSETKYAEDN